MDEESAIWIQYPFFGGGNMRQWCEGKDLRSKAAAAVRVAEAVALLHEHSIAHGDLKPENIVFPSAAADACPALIDFELAMDASQTMMTATTAGGAGTYLYKAPNDPPDAIKAADVYALGVTLYDFVFGDCVLESLPTRAFFGGLQMLVVEDVVAALTKVEGSDETSPLMQKMAALTKRMLDERPEERPNSTEVHVRLQHIALEPTAVTEYDECAICLCEFPVANGLRCTNRAEPHFLCDTCLGKHVMHEAEADLEQIERRKGCSVCPQREFDCESAPYADDDLALHVRGTPGAFDLYLKGRTQLLEKEFARSADKRVQHELEKLAEMDEHQREVLRTRTHITENIINLKCPGCSRVFLDFTGCFALKCAFCPCRFCAWCLQDCGADAHDHVLRECAKKPTANASYYGTKQQFETQNLGRRKRMLCDYLGDLAPQLRSSVLLTMTIDLHDVGLSDVAQMYI